MLTLCVDLADRSYPIWVAPRLMELVSAQWVPQLKRRCKKPRVMLVSPAPVCEHYLDAVVTCLRAEGVQVDTLMLPDGEPYKTLDTFNQVISELLRLNYDRSTTLVALGGGVTGDIVGFAAAAYQRGIDFVQMPTSLLAQVDSSVGGKTGVNHALGKNMIGAFYQPQAVLIGLDVLNTLPAREFRSGLAEVIKYGLIYDADFFDWIEAHVSSLLNRVPEVLQRAIFRSCEIKAAIVAADEREAGQRAILNLGHTFAHAFEAGLGYGQMLHGEAVGLGLLMATDLSCGMGWVPQGLVARVFALLKKIQLPITFPATLSLEQVRALMQRDKKVYQQHLRLVLLKVCGQAVVTSDFDQSLLDSAIMKRQNAG